MAAPKPVVKNLDAIVKKDPKLGEALAGLQDYISKNTTPAAGNKTPAPTFVTPGKPPG